ncbi:MAG TPA: S9 family peptidase [Nocardioidaceae bacterium]|nr:S9 family peptidase [Nocardioidaceae bacterium]
MTQHPQVRPYGSWPTAITSELVVRALARPDEVVAGEREVWWSEIRAEEGGRTQLVRCVDGERQDLLGDDANARTAVHEYGGGAWWVHTGSVWFANWSDQRLYRRSPDGTCRAVTPAPERPRSRRWADGCVHPEGHVMAVVRESHPVDGTPADVVNEIVLLPVDGGEAEVVAGDADFVADPRWSPDGRMLCWLEWDHPDMPWDSTRLRVRRTSGDPADVDDLGVVAGGPGESVFQPRWAPDGSLWFASDRSGWWNLYRWRPGTTVEAMVTMEADIGRPHWVFRQSCYALLADGTVVFAYQQQGRDRLALRRPDGTVADLGPEYTVVESVQAAGDTVVLVAASPTREPAVLRLHVGSDGVESVDVLRPPRDLGLDEAWWSVPEHVSFPTSGGRTAHALFYAPRSPECVAPDGERPPLLVFIHGGPTGAARPMLRLDVQYWTSRGFAVVDVNYGGSTGYGRAYREQLKGRWGVVDVDDCVAAARWLAEHGRVDGDRLCIRGGSAGGFTTLAALAFHDIFSAGANHFGVADLEALTQETHKFESRYLDGLVGPYPQRRDLYVERSPIHHIDSFDTPLAVFQGLEDAVVPPAQSEMIVDALRAKGVPVAYLPFEGEQHGFRQAGNVRRALDAELSFYAQVFGFALPAEEGIAPLAVENLTRGG